MKTILMSGFEPFDGETINPALEAVKQLDGRVIQMDGAEGVIRSVGLPTVFGACMDVLRAEIERVQPDVVICVGQAGGRTGLTPERIAINVDDGRIPDNSGAAPVDQPIVAGAPAAYFSTLPIKRIVEMLRSEGIPSYVSNTAGTYVCNHIFYQVMHDLALRTSLGTSIRGGFIHIPYLPEQVAHRNESSMSLEVIVRGLEKAAEVSLAHASDLVVTGGTEH